MSVDKRNTKIYLQIMEMKIAPSKLVQIRYLKRDWTVSELTHQLASCGMLDANGMLTVTVVPDIDKTILEATCNGSQSFDMETWHFQGEYGTTHCRAGWAVHLADAYALEPIVGSSGAGAIVYFVSAGYVPDFWQDNLSAIEDMKVHAGFATEIKERNEAELANEE